MHRKHYKRIAAILSEHKVPLSPLMYDLMKYFKEDNPNFDRDKFIEACSTK